MKAEPWTSGNLWAHGQQVIPDWHFNPSLYQLSGCEGMGTAEIEDFTQVCFLRQRWPWQLEQIFMVVGQPRKPQMIEHRRWPSGV
ncbi:hypothetical protein BRARA_J00507 [Brassica rapa]|uniref:Uncharacterized protein n=1 Tax=Brassica campestris TaxID=3711 RepID=A0A397XIK7_BRACM|nr:hypothetical protein BRARA_J00507 [Brassica rapa]